MPSHTVTIQGLKITSGLVLNGGGILNDHATATIHNCLVVGNEGDDTGGGISNDHGTLTVDSSTVTGNGGYVYNGGNGGGLANLGEPGSASLTIVNSSVSGNHGGEGGGIYNQGTLTITNSTVSNNWVYVYGTFSSRAGGISNSGTLDIIDSTISNNMTSALGDGGGVVSYGSFTLTNSIVNGNSAGYEGGGGGGIVNGGSLTINNCTLSSNHAPGARDGVFGYGGAILNSGTLEIVSSALYNNGASASGGAIVSGGTSATLTISNSTFSGNVIYPIGGSRGGAIANSGPLGIAHSTFHGNSAGTGGGVYNSGSLSLGNTIFDANTGINIFNNTGGTVTSHGYNVSSDDVGGYLTGPGDQINTNAMLGPLQNNGGITYTHALLNGSPAIDAGDPNFTPPPLYDQRGFGYARVFNGRIDIGSLEVQPAFTPAPTPTATATATASASPAQALNLSTRLHVLTDANVGIGGIIITGTDPKTVVVRGIGPSLSGVGVTNPLADPVLELHGPTGFTTITNDNWMVGNCMPPLGLPPTNPLESCIEATLNPGAYTAILKGNDNGAGVGLVEVYDVGQAANSKLVNLSTRGFVSTGGDIMIAGFILGGNSGSDNVIVRGIGPSLTQLGVPNALANPQLELHNSSGTLIRSNNDWMDDPAQAALIMAAGLPPTDNLEAAIYETLAPGQYTALLSGVRTAPASG